MQNAVEAGDAKAALAKRNSDGISPRQIKELEAVQTAAQAALLAELAALRQQKAAAEEESRRSDYLVGLFALFTTMGVSKLPHNVCCGQVGDLHDQHEEARKEVERMAAIVADKERENSKLWQQMRTAASEYHQEFVAKEATIGALIKEAEATKQRMQTDIDKLRAGMEVRDCCSSRIEATAI